MVRASVMSFYKVAIKDGQTLRVVVRTRDLEAHPTAVKLHGPDGGFLGGYTLYGESNLGRALEYKAQEVGTAYVSLSGGVRGSALQIAAK